MNLKKVRNIGISAHIDSGKTTLSERILFYAGRIHKIEEVRGGGDGATMDHMELEKERGMRVLDGAVLVLCAVGGVQAQSLTVDRQMKRYKVPRLAFINKMDRTGADPFSVVEQMREKLGTDAVLVQLPIGEGETYEGEIDLVEMKAYYNDGDKGEVVRTEEIPEKYVDQAKEYRGKMLEALSMYNDDMMEKLLAEEEIDTKLIHKVIKEATQAVGANSFTPVFMGTAFKNKGVQTLLDAVVRYLPSPDTRDIVAKQWDDPDQPFELTPDKDKPFVGMAFKIVEDTFGQLTYMRIYQGTVKKGETYFNQRTSKKDRFSRVLRMHSDK